MTHLETFFGPPLHNAAAVCLPILLDATIKGTLLLILAGLAVRFMRRASAASRHLVWFLALVSLPALVILSSIADGWHVLPNWLTVSINSTSVSRSTREVETAPTKDAALAPEDLVSIPTDDSPHVSPAVSQAGKLPAMVATLPPIAPAAKHGNIAAPSGSRQLASWPAWILGLWLLGMFLGLCHLAGGMASLARVRSRADRITAGPWASRLAELATEMGVRRKLTLLSSRDRVMPMHWGILRPKLLLPAVAGGWSAHRLRVVLLHELAHVRRRDCAVRLVGRLICAVFWFHPMVWIVQRRLLLESEAASDDLALRTGCNARDYAGHLLAVASTVRANRWALRGALAMARSSHLEHRLRAILDPQRNRRGTTRGAALFAACGFAAVVMPLSMMRSGGGLTTAQANVPAVDVLDGMPSANRLPVDVPDGIPSANRLPVDVPGGIPSANRIEEGPGGHGIVDAADTSDRTVAWSPRNDPFAFELVRLGDVDESAESSRSIAGSGHAVKLSRPAAAKSVVAVQIHAARYGYPQPPGEDFHVYLLDANRDLIRDLHYPYAKIDRGEARWHTLQVPDVDVPEEFYVALSFNPHRTKGVYLGMDRDVERSHSFEGLPGTGFAPVAEPYDWMIRAFLLPD